MMHLTRRTFHIILIMCMFFATMSCKEENSEKLKRGIDQAKTKASRVKANVTKLKDGASELPGKLIADAKAKRLMEMSQEDFDQKIQDNLTEIRRYDEGLARIIRRSNERPDLFPKGKTRIKAFKNLKPTQRKELRALWAGTLDYMRALDGVKHYWSDFHRIDIITHPSRHAAAFLVSYAAWMVQYRHGLSFIELSMPNKGLETFLDEPSARDDIPTQGFKQLKSHIISVKAVSRFMGSRQYYKLKKKTLHKSTCKDKTTCKWTLGRLEQYHKATKTQLEKRAAIQFSYNTYDIVRDAAFSSWFPVQRGVAEWLGDTKVKRIHAHLITDAQLYEMNKLMEPGDIIVARKNWYLSNIGLPGFWPHAELFIGSPEAMKDYFQDTDLSASLPQLKGATLSKYLQDTYPEAWKAYTSKPDHHGDTHQIIEAISEGVVFSSLERGAGADYVGVIRPRRDKVAKATAIIRAFAYWGRPYDFNFDFLTDATLVCTELVFKAWEKDDTHQGLDLNLIEVMGRSTLPANDIVRQFASERAQDDGTRQLDFVYFLDGRERTEGAIIGSQDDFAASCDRPKWDTAQQ